MLLSFVAGCSFLCIGVPRVTKSCRSKDQNVVPQIGRPDGVLQLAVSKGKVWGTIASYRVLQKKKTKVGRTERE